MSQPVAQGFRLSPQQRRLWTLQRETPGFPYRARAEVRIEGRLDRAALAAALADVAARHEILRTTFPQLPGRTLPAQSIREPAPGLLRLEEQDLSALDLLWEEMGERPFQPDREPPVALALVSLSPESHRLFIAAHALAADAAALAVLVRELRQAYAARLGRGTETEEPAQYADVAEALNELLESEETGEGRDFWREAAAGYRGAGRLPLEKATPEGGFLPHTVSMPVSMPAGARVLAAAQELADDLSVPLAAVPLAAWHAVLRRLASEEQSPRSVIAVELAGRHYEGFESALGLFARSVPIGLSLDDDLPFAQLVSRAAEGLATAADWQDYFSWEVIPGGEIPWVPVAFRFTELPAAETAGDATFILERLGARIDRFALQLAAVRGPEELRLELSYDASRFTAEDARRLLAACQAVLAHAVGAPGTRIGDLEVVSPEERRRLLEELNRTARPIAPIPVHELFAAQARRSPDAVAVSDAAGVSLTYAELACRAAALAGHLRRLGVEPDVRVGLCADRSVEMMVGVLSILEAGGAYVPLDPGYPPARLAYMLEASRAPVLLVGENPPPDLPHSLPTTLPGGEAPPPIVVPLAGDWGEPGGDVLLPEMVARESSPPSPLSHLPPTQAPGEGESWIGEAAFSSSPGGGRVEDGRGGPGGEDSTRECHPFQTPSDVNPENAAYVLFTSGSTGVPKGVVVRHRALTNHMLWMAEAYPLVPGDRVLQKTPLSFDASVWELFAPLLAGTELVLATPGVQRDPAGLAREAAERGATDLQVVPALLRLLLDEEAFAACRSLRRLFAGGEPLTADLSDRFHRLFPEADLINLYGPTETTVQMTSWVAGRGETGSAVPIGRPIHNARVYLLDRGLLPVPEGMAGELWIGGEPPARGYLDRPDLTAAAFRPDPFTVEPGARMYGSGDLARYLDGGDGGVLDFLGRAGRPIKIRGYRFDPGEVEAVLRGHEAVRDAAVLVREDRPGDERLAAYLVPREGGAPPLSDLRALLAERLPEFMVPSDFVVLPAFPLTPSGKLDRAALPAPEAASGAVADTTGFAVPRTAVEEVLAEIWAGLLGRERVGIDDDFFELGGHSLLGAQLVARMRDAFGVEVSLRSVFETPTVAGLARQVESAWRVSAAPPIEREPRPPGAAVPLSFAQRRLWFLNRLAPESTVYNIASAVRFAGPLDEQALAAAFNEIVRLHEVLRSTFQEQEGEPVQVGAPELAVPMPVVDLTALPRVLRELEAESLARAEARLPFDLARGPLVRLTLLRLNPEERVLLTSLHHIVSDAWSVGIFYRDLMDLYEAFAARRPSPLPALPVQYADFALWQRRWFQGEARERELAWWRRQLADLPALSLPTDRPRPARQSFRGAALELTLPLQVAQPLRALARSWSVTPFMLLLAAFQTLLHRHTGQVEIVTGSPVANRERSEIEGLIGFFVNTLVLRGNLAGNPPFLELAGRARELALGAWAHQALPFEMLVEELRPERDVRSQGHQPLFQVIFQLQNVPLPAFRIAGVTVEPLDVETGTAHFDLGVDALEMDDGLLFVASYATDLFDATTIRRLLAHFATLLHGIVADPQARIGELPLLSEAERHQAGHEWNDTAMPVDLTPVHRRIAAQAARRPDAPAVRFEGQTLTYGELDRRTGRLARQLRALGVRRGTPVGLCLERSVDLPAAVLAIFQAGGIFLPLDPDLPGSRLAAMVEDAFQGDERALVLTRGDLILGKGIDDLPARVVRLEDLADAAEEDLETEDGVGPDDLAYLIYTSGTSGRPKAVAVEHGNLASFVDVSLRGVSLPDRGWDEDDRMAGLAAFSFDAFFLDTLVPLAAGGIVHIVPHRPALDVEALVRELPQITRFFAVPSLIREIVERVRSGPGAIRGLRTVIPGGERVTEELIADLREVFPGAAVTVIYGTTEGTVHCSSYPVPADDDRGLLGRPIGNATLTVLDAYGNLAPIGVPGEIVQGGAGVARGYLGREELTRERFFTVDGVRFYRSGDLGRWLPDGNLEFLGRLDHQVKIRGFRIELGEIEAVLSAHPAVRAAVVVARKDSPGEPRIVGYTVCDLTHPSLAEPGAEELAGEQAERWRTVYEGVHGRDERRDPAFDVSGWNSSYTGGPIPADEMREWVEGTVSRILSRLEDGARVLEIGCGTGLLLFRIAPRCREYLATDLSESALAAVRGALGRLPEPLPPLPEIRLRQAAADDFTGVEPGSFDAVVLNSVVQYFPDADYLMRVLGGAVEAVRPGGFVFVGDVRSLPLLDAFHFSVELAKAVPSLSREQLAARCTARREEEPELVIDPRLFAALPGRWPRVSGAEVQLRRGRRWNELTRFRYDAILSMDAPPQAPIVWTEWESLTPEELRQKLAAETPERVAVRRVANARVAADLAAMSPSPPGGEGSGGIDPEDYWALAADLPYDVAVTPSAGGPGLFDVLFQRREEGRPAFFALPAPSIESWEALTNHPLQRRMAHHAVPRLRVFLAERLPDYMVPAAIVLLDRLPLGSTGKVDRRALPAPERARPELGGEMIAPRTPAEEILAGLFAGVLGLDRVGVRDDFFALGGHSLLATQLVSQIRRAFGLEIELRALFESPTVEGLAQRLEELERGSTTAPPLVPRVWEGAERPLSFAQRRLWFLDRLEPGSATYNMLSGLRIRGLLDVRALAASLDEIARRHEVLRARIVEDVVESEGEPVAVVDPPGHRPLPLVDLSALPSRRRDPETRRLAAAEAARPFDLARGPLLRATVLRLDDRVDRGGRGGRSGRSHALLLTLHHIVSDGWSEGVLVREVSALYPSFAAGRPLPLPALPVRYADFAAWQREWLQGPALDAQLDYWRGRLAGAPPRLELPADHPRPALPSGRGRTLGFSIPAATAEAVRALCRETGTTPFMALFAAFGLLLGRHAGQDDVLVGTPIANRNRNETEGLIGFFVNTLVLRVDLTGEPTGRELLARVREEALGAYAHQDLPFERLVEELRPDRGAGHQVHQPLFQAMFQLQNVPRTALQVAGLTLEPLDVDPGTAPFDLSVDAMETAAGLLLAARYAADLFDGTTVRRLLAHFEILLHALTADPEARAGDLPLLSDAERHQAAIEWNDTTMAVDLTPAHRRIAAQAALRPDAPAVTFAGETLTHGDLDRRSAQLAARLRALGVRRGTPVGLFTKRSLDLPVALLAIWRAGGVFLPLDPGLPAPRLAAMVEDAFQGSAESLVLTAGGAGAALEGLPTRVVRLEDLDLGMEDVGEGASPSPTAGKDEVPEPGDLAYLIFTSGSTGRPKAVAVEHGSLASLMDVSLRVWGWDERDRMASLSAFSFDVFLFELLVPLAAGGAVEIFPLRPAFDLERFVRALPGLTRFHAVPSLMREIVQAVRTGPGAILGLRSVFSGGEQLPDEVAAGMRQVFPGAEHYVLYGPTEGTVFCSGHLLPPDSDRGLLGRPLGNAGLTVRDVHGHLTPIGTAGEIVLRGLGVARGYFGREELTRERFFTAGGERFYRTGDRGRWLADGNLEFLGRLDHQVKIRGIRIELGEIEAVLAAIPGVRQAVVLMREESDRSDRSDRSVGSSSDRRLVAYVVGDVPVAELRRSLCERLPDAMVPAAFVLLDRLPLSPHGKVDRRALPAPEQAQPEPGAEWLAPRTPTEEILAGLFADVLGLDRVGVHDGFFALGGHSLLATRLAYRIRRTFRVELPLSRLFKNATLADLALEIEAASRPGRKSVLDPIVPVPRTGLLPTTFYQEWVWRVQGGPVSNYFNISAAWRLRGPLDLGALAGAFAALIGRHESVRTRMMEIDGVILQEPLAAVEASLPMADLAALPAAAREREVARLAVEEGARPMDLSRPPLLRGLLIRLGDQDQAVLVTISHAVSDGWSVEVLQGDLIALYVVAATGRPSPLPDLPVQYADFGWWQRERLDGEPIEAQLDWWRRRLADLPPPLDLSAGRGRPERLNPEAVSWAWELPSGLVADLRALGRETACTLPILLTTALAVLLYRETGQEEMTLASIFSGRTRPDLHRLIGLFMNTIVLRADLSGDPTFRELLPRLRDTVLEAYDRQDVSFPRLFAELFPGEPLDRTRLARVAFNMLSFPAASPTAAPLPMGTGPGGGGLVIENIETLTEKALYDLLIMCREHGDVIYCQYIGAADVFDAARLEALGRDFTDLLERAAADPDLRLGRLSES